MSGPRPGGPSDERDDDDHDPRDGTHNPPGPRRTGDDAGDERSSSTGHDSNTGHDSSTGHGRPTPSSRSRPARSADDSPRRNAVTPDDGLLRWFLRSDDGRVVAVRDVLTSVAIVALVGLVLFAASGAWPPLVAVESGSMEPNMVRGDLIFVVDDDRYAGDGAIAGTGVVTREVGAENGHATFGQPGDVIIFRPDGSEFRTPVIHRAHFWVEEGENWVDTKANPDYLGGATCAEIATCPAEHDGFVTKGDANRGYDQAVGGASTDVVKPEWVTGKGMFRVPWLGHVRLAFDELLFSSPVEPSGTASASTSSTPTAPTTPDRSTGVDVGLLAVASVAAFVGSRRPGSW